MKYNEAMNYIEELGKRGSVLGLGSITNLLERLGNPQDKVPVIHVAGTNGKGSICTFLEAMYKAEGKRVGRYISPTLGCYLERFQINGELISKEAFAGHLQTVKEKIDEMSAGGLEVPTAFEAETAVAFLYFAAENVDIVILETGMGGREDATNVVAKPLCTVFGSIGMDHMQFLGDRIEKIAYEKAGIIKDGCPAVSYPNDGNVIEVLEEECGLHNTKLATVKCEDIVIKKESLTGSTFLYKNEEYSISLAGEYQIYNAATAIETKLLLDGKLDKTSLHNITWEGRFQVVSENPLIIKDGAHNVDGVSALKKSIKNHFTNKRIIFIIGILKDKEYEKMAELLCPMAECIYTVTTPGIRGLAAEKLKKCADKYCDDVKACKSVDEALDKAKTKYGEFEKAGSKAVIVAWGSLSYIGQIE